MTITEYLKLTYPELNPAQIKSLTHYIAEREREAEGSVFDRIDAYYLRHDGEGEHSLVHAIDSMRPSPTKENK